MNCAIRNILKIFHFSLFQKNERCSNGTDLHKFDVKKHDVHFDSVSM